MKQILTIFLLAISAFAQEKAAPKLATSTKPAPTVTASREVDLELDAINLQIKANNEKLKAVEEALNGPLRDKVNALAQRACAEAKIDLQSCGVNTNTRPWQLVDQSKDTGKK